ncbi:hypothetical protein Plhal304r1_c026g0087061 [Plasmopara halstedii]
MPEPRYPCVKSIAHHGFTMYFCLVDPRRTISRIYHLFGKPTHDPNICTGICKQCAAAITLK